MIHTALGIDDARDKELCKEFAQLLKLVNNKGYSKQEELVDALIKAGLAYIKTMDLPANEQHLLFLYIGSALENYVTQS